MLYVWYHFSTPIIYFLLKSSQESSGLEWKLSVQFLKCIGLVFISLNLGIGMEVTTETLSKPFLISPTYLKLVPYEANNLLFPVLGFGTILVFTQRNGLKSKKIFISPCRYLKIHTNYSKLIEVLVCITRMCSPRQVFTSVMAQTIYEGDIYSLGGCVITKIQVIITLGHNIWV